MSETRPESEKSLMIWVVSDGRRGIENQPLGLAEAVKARLEMQGRSVRIERVVARKDHYVTLPDSAAPDLWIGCGRTAIPVVRKHRRIFPDCFFVYVQDPREQHDEFDLIIAPEHDRLKRPNAVAMLGSPNRVTAAQLADIPDEMRARANALPSPRASLLIGGDSKRYRLTPKIADYLETRIDGLLDQGLGLMITVSRRTPDAIRKRLLDRFGEDDRVWFYDDEGENPYFAFLALADWIFVTEESTNMLVEAGSTGRQVYALPLEGKPGKFAHLHASLEGAGIVRPYLGQLERWDYIPLNETDRMAGILIQTWLGQTERPAQTGEIA